MALTIASGRGKGGAMFDVLIKMLEGSPEEARKGYSEREIGTAVTALYYRMIAVDGVLTPDEVERMRSIVQEQFKVDGEKLDAFVEEGILADRDSPALFPFTAILNREFSVRQRREILQRLTELAEADGGVEKVEQDLLEHVASLLHLADQSEPV